MRIAFAGPRGTGKTTLAEYLVRRYGFRRCSLATPIKRMINEAPADGHDRHQFFWRWAEELFPGCFTLQARFATEAGRLFITERDAGRRAQQLGTDIGRALDPEVWIQYLLRHLPRGPVAVDDVRFPNECERLRDAGFTLIRLVAPADVLAARLAARPAERRDGAHVSEHALDGLPNRYYDAVWDTSEPLESTAARLEALLASGGATPVDLAEEIPHEGI